MNIKLPDFSNTDWKSVIEGAEPLDRELLVVQARAVNMLDGFGEVSTSEKLGWLILWSHIYNYLQLN